MSRVRRRLSVAMLATFTGILLLLGLSTTSDDLPWSARMLATVATAAALAPAAVYASTFRSKRRPIPFLPAIGVLYALQFALPLAFGEPSAPGLVAGGLSDGDVTTSALLVTGGWMVLLTAYWLAGRTTTAPGLHLERYAFHQGVALAAWILVGVGMATDALRLAHPIALSIAGPASLLTVLGWVGAGLLIGLWAQNRLGLASRVFTAGAILVSSGLQVATGSVANAARLWFILLIAAWVARGGRARARWVVLAIVAVMALVILRGSAAEFRARAWFDPGLSTFDRLETYASIVDHRVRDEGILGTVEPSLLLVAERIVYAGVLADVVQKTPEVVPFWRGETYLSLVGAVVPRFLWPSKPEKDLGQRFGHRYGYLDPSDDRTSFNLPFLIEFYANFGVIGVILGMSVVGGLYRIVEDVLNRPEQPTTTSIVALAILVPLLTVESDFSLVFGGLILNGLAVLVLVRLLTRSSETVRCNEGVQRTGRRRYRKVERACKLRP